MAEFQPKRLFGFVPFWPTYPVGFYVGVLARDIVGILRGRAGRRYLRQRWQQRHPIFRIAVVGWLPQAVASAVQDEFANIWRSRLNQRRI
jgi:hypothetical protein